ncbi:SAM-dependent methyltransferase [Planctomycetales bacterium]|nr:SAM-dependent methyltransferase [Planctomycetales bacterium]
MTNQYELLDFGYGRRLERFENTVLDRPCPAAENAVPVRPGIWKTAAFRFDEKWTAKIPPQIVNFGVIKMKIDCTPFGHIGVFPEQIPNWEQMASLRADSARILNLFAYTGGSSIAAALSGKNVEVVHVDSAKGIVRWAKENAQINGIQTIRFITEDIRKFVHREIKRGNRYDGIILDPPSFGHGVQGEVWKFSDDLPPLLASLAGLFSKNPLFFLLTAHTSGIGSDDLLNMTEKAEIRQNTGLKAKKSVLRIPAAGGRFLESGCGVWLFR